MVKPIKSIALISFAQVKGSAVVLSSYSSSASKSAFTQFGLSLAALALEALQEG